MIDSIRLHGLRLRIKGSVLRGARFRWEKSLFSYPYDVINNGLVGKVDFIIVLCIMEMMNRRYRRETIIEKCKVTLSSSKRLLIAESILEELE